MLPYITAQALSSTDFPKLIDNIFAGLTVARSKVHVNTKDPFESLDEEISLVLILYLANGAGIQIPECLLAFELPKTTETLRKAANTLCTAHAVFAYPEIPNLYAKLLARAFVDAASTSDLQELHENLIKTQSVGTGDALKSAIATVEGLSRLRDVAYQFPDKLDLVSAAVLTSAVLDLPRIAAGFGSFSRPLVRSATAAELLVCSMLVPVNGPVWEEVQRRDTASLTRSWTPMLRSAKPVTREILLQYQKDEIPASNAVEAWMKSTEKEANIADVKLREPRKADTAEQFLLNPDTDIVAKTFGALVFGLHEDLERVLAVGDGLLKEGKFSQAADIYRNVLSLADGSKINLNSVLRKFQTCQACTHIDRNGTSFVALLQQESLTSSLNTPGSFPPNTLLVAVDVFGARLIVTWNELGAPAGVSGSRIVGVAPADLDTVEFEKLKRFLTAVTTINTGLEDISSAVASIVKQVWDILGSLDFVKSASEASPVDIVLCLGEKLFDFPVELALATSPVDQTRLRFCRDLSADFFMTRLARYRGNPGLVNKLIPVLKRALFTLVSDAENSELVQDLISRCPSRQLVRSSSSLPLATIDLLSIFGTCDFGAILKLESNPSISVAVKCFTHTKQQPVHAALLSASLIQDPRQGKHLDRFSHENSVFACAVSLSVCGISACLLNVIRDPESATEESIRSILTAIKEGKSLTQWSAGSNVIVGIPWLAAEPEGKAKK